MNYAPVANPADWTRTDHIESKVRDVVVSIHTNVVGSGEVLYPLHTLCLIEYRGPLLERVAPAGDDVLIECTGVSLLFMPKGTVMLPRHEYPADITTIAIPDRWFEAAAGSKENYARLVFTQFDTKADPVLLHAARMLRALALEARPIVPVTYNDVLISATAIRIINLVCDGDECSHADGAPMLSEAQMEMVRGFVRENVGEPIRLSLMADVIGLSQFHFSRAFKATTGRTPMRYVLEQRVEAAKAMLKEKGSSIAEVAFSTGFSSQSHFTTAFRQVAGMTPSAWRMSLGSLLSSLLVLAASPLLDLLDGLM